jgi:hypothetical protein
VTLDDRSQSLFRWGPIPKCPWSRHANGAMRLGRMWHTGSIRACGERVRRLAQATRLRPLRQIESENERLKQLLAERDLEIEVMKEIARKMVGAPVRRRQVAYANQRGLSLRRVRALMCVARSTLHYETGRAHHHRSTPTSRCGTCSKRIDVDTLVSAATELPITRLLPTFSPLPIGEHSGASRLDRSMRKASSLRLAIAPVVPCR